MREDERGPADPVYDFESGAWTRGNKGFTGEGFHPVDLVGKGDKVASLVDSFYEEKGWSGRRYCEETPSRASTEISGFRCLPSRTSKRPPPHGREIKEGDTLAEKNDARARHSWFCSVRGSVERRLSRLLSCVGWGEWRSWRGLPTSGKTPGGSLVEAVELSRWADPKYGATRGRERSRWVLSAERAWDASI